MKRVMVTGQTSLVTSAASGRRPFLPSAHAHIGDLMGRMAIGAYGSAHIPFGQQLPVNALVVGLLDAYMTFAAGLGDIGMADGGITIDISFDVMHAMAVVAGGCHDQTHFDQCLPVDAVAVFLGRVGMFDLVFPREAAIAVAFGAGEGQVHLEHRRRRITYGKNVMRAVAIPAFGCARRAEQVAHAVDARAVGLGLFFVAEVAFRRRQRAVVRELRYLGVTVQALKVGMNGMGKGLRRENQRLRFSIDDPGGTGIEMTTQTIAVGQFLRRLGRGRFLAQRDATRQPGKGE